MCIRVLYRQCTQPAQSCVSRSILSLRHDLSLTLRTPLPKDRAPDSNLAAPHGNSALEILAHPHAQLELILRIIVQPQLFRHGVPLAPERHKVLVLVLGRGGDAARDGADGHEAEQVEVRTRLVRVDELAQRQGLGARGAAGLGLLAGGVDLDVDVEFSWRWGGGGGNGGEGPGG